MALGFAAPVIVPASALGRSPSAQSPANRVRLGFIGVRNQGTNNLRAFLRQENAELVAICDVDASVREKAARLASLISGKSCAVYHDYRQLLDRDDIDAVVITTPDHWHALPTVDACAAGKDVYCEKPLSLTVAEGRAMVQAARKFDRIVQTGSQQRSDDRFRRACELVRSGALGRLSSVLVGLPGVNFDGPSVPDSEPPTELDYDFWLGPAPFRPYNPKQVHYNFRFFWPYSGGQLTNWGAHHLDIVQWALGMDDSGPVRVSGRAEFHPDSWYEVPMRSEVVFTYSGGLEVHCRQGYGDPNGIRFKGENGSLFVARGKLEATPPELLQADLGEDLVALERSENHQANWLQSILERRRPICDVEIGHRSATVCHLGNIALRTGRPVEWDPTTETLTADEEASALLDQPYRAPWRLDP